MKTFKILPHAVHNVHYGAGVHSHPVPSSTRPASCSCTCILELTAGRLPILPLLLPLAFENRPCTLTACEVSVLRYHIRVTMGRSCISHSTAMCPFFHVVVHDRTRSFRGSGVSPCVYFLPDI